MNKINNTINNFKNSVEDKLKSSGITVENAIVLAIKAPGTRINREKFLKKELLGHFPDETINKAILSNPASAKIPKKFIDDVANKIISYETNKVSAISFAAGIPGGAAMIATVPADIAQYFGFMLRVMQKLAYLYGFDEFELDEKDINDDTMNQLLIFLGVMFGVQGANAGVKFIADCAAQRVIKTLPKKALMKTAFYPLIKKIATKIGIHMNKTIFARGVSKIVPVVGGVITGSITYATFKPSAIRLKKSFSALPICDPDSEFYSSSLS